MKICSFAEFWHFSWKVVRLIQESASKFWVAMRSSSNIINILSWYLKDLIESRLNYLLILGMMPKSCAMHLLSLNARVPAAFKPGSMSPVFKPDWRRCATVRVADNWTVWTPRRVLAKQRILLALPTTKIMMTTTLSASDYTGRF